MAAGFARIEVRFLIDANGILNVTARDARTGKEHSVEVKPSYGLSEDQVEAMIRESIDKAEQDMRERQVREARVEADNILSATGKGPAKRCLAWLDGRRAVGCRIGQARPAKRLQLGRSSADQREN